MEKDSNLRRRCQQIYSLPPLATRESIQIYGTYRARTYDPLLVRQMLSQLIVMENKKAVMKYPKNCWGCVSCVKECKAGAIDFFLGADIGGNGSIMNVKSEGDILHWIITKTDGSTSVIDVDRRNSNKY